MKLEIFAVVAACLIFPLQAEPKRKSLLDSDPEVVYLDQTLTKPIELKVIKEAPVFSDKKGTHRLGTLKADQTVRVEAITEKNYRVRGQGTRDAISGWVAPWAFSSSDPEFVANLKSLYERQMQVQKLIADKQIAIGMSLEEVTMAQGKPTKTAVRKTASGESGRWDYVDYDYIKHYATTIDPVSGRAYQRVVSVTQVEKGRTTVEFENDTVTAIEESKAREGGNVKVIVPPLVFRW
jgi:hypothetical protein